ncbi:MAG TPA: MarR family transcriptional regulator [Sphingobium sp.]
MLQLKRELPHTLPTLTGGAKDIGPLADLVSVQLRRVDVLLTRGFFAVAKAMNVRSSLIACLGLIAANPGISQQEIALQIGSDKSIITSLVADLEERGWAERKRAARDNRRYELKATLEGEAMLAEFARHIRDIETTMLADIAPEELQTLAALLQRMHQSCMTALSETEKG